MKLHEPTVAALAQIPWFTNCGRYYAGDQKLAIHRAMNWEEAMANCSSPEWEELTLMASNDYKQFLRQKNRFETPQEWNGLMDQAKTVYDQVIAPAVHELMDRHGLEVAFEHSVQWDIAHGIVVMSYGLRGAPNLFSELFQVYMAGHFPCGWLGKWPEGKLIVF